MSVREVNFASTTAETFENLKKAGRVRGIFDNRYLQALKEGVEYWDGTKWVKTPTEIQRPKIADK